MELKKTPTEGDIERRRVKGVLTVRIFTGGEWFVASAGDTYKGQLLIPKEETPLPLEQQYVGGLRLIRGWQLSNDNKLQSLASQYTWSSGVLVAHDSPTLNNHGAGFFGFYKWPYAESQLQGHIMGTYLGWGRSVRGEHGFRTQYAKLEALRDPNNHTSATVQLIADELGVPMLSPAEITELKTGLVRLEEKMVYPDDPEESVQ